MQRIGLFYSVYVYIVYCILLINFEFSLRRLSEISKLNLILETFESIGGEGDRNINMLLAGQNN